MLISWIPFMMLAGVWSGWRRLASLYSERPAGRGRSRRHTGMVMGMANYRGGVRLAADDSHLHFSMTALLRPGHPPFSVPWSDITIARDEWPWFPFKGHPVTRITLARHRSLRVLVPESTGDLIITASENRLHLTGSRVAAATAT